MSKIIDSEGNCEDEDFKPIHIPFDDGIKRIKNSLSEAKVKLGSRIFTSRDTDVVKLCNLLSIDSGLPTGMTKWQLPFHLEGVQFFITTSQSGAKVGEHSHNEDGVRFIVSGSIIYDGIELNSGDWMFLPKGERYSFTVGPHGAMMFYCYQCCCAGKTLSRHQEVINPVHYVRERKSLSK